MRRLSAGVALAAALFGLSAGHVAARGKAKKKAATDAPATREVDGACTDSDATALWWSPLAPAAGQTIKIMAVGDGSADLTVTDPHGDEKALTTVRRDGPPTSVSAEYTTTRAGAHRLIWRRAGKPIACRKIPVAAKAETPKLSLSANV